MPSNSPAISVVLVTPDIYATVAKTMTHLRAQMAHEQIEMILVVPSRAELSLPAGAMNGFGATQLLEVGPGRSISQSRAAGALAATAPIVAFAEDHCFPEADWAEKLLMAHAGPYAAVGPLFFNGNPHTALSWADYLHNFGTWGHPVPSAEMATLPWHNTSYKRDVLEAYGERLSQMFEVEGRLQNEIKSGGARLYLESGARVHHLNVSGLWPFVKALYHSGRLFGGTRALNWNFLNRVAHFATAPLIPLARLPRLFGQYRRQRRAGALPSRPPKFIGFALASGCLCHVAGEAVGFLFGVGNARLRKSESESHRIRFLCHADRQALLRAEGELDIG